MIDHWHNCYDNGWKGLITDAAFAHPAKFSHGLIKRIYTHLLAEGMVKPGAVVLDPFGGVALGGLYAMQNGLHWVGCELESKFVELGQANIDLWNARYAGHFPRWGSAQLLQGDSRRLAEIVAGAGCVPGGGYALVGSPPYAESMETSGGIDPSRSNHIGGPNSQMNRSDTRYGQADGQLGAMKPGSPPAPLLPRSPALISSPPFAGNTGGRGEASRNGIDPGLFDRHSGGMKRGTGSDPANLDNLRMGAVVSSPPYEGSISAKENQGDVKTAKDRQRILEQTGIKLGGGQLSNRNYYGDSVAQLGNDSGETFWTAARLILNQCALLLPPGAPAVWVTKRYVKSGKIVEFSQQWAQLCEACGFEVVHWHRAMLVKNNGTQDDIFGNGHSKTVARKSFFRRLAESKGSPAIDWEDVICTVRREAA